MQHEHHEHDTMDMTLGKSGNGHEPEAKIAADSQGTNGHGDNGHSHETNSQDQTAVKTSQGHSTHDHSGSGDSGHNHSGHNHSGHDHSGHDHSGHMDHVAMFQRLFWIMLALAVPVIAFNSMFASLIGYTLPDTAWVEWVSPILGTVMFVWGGKPFLSGGLREVKDRQPGMMLLIALAITVAFISSWGSSLHLLGHELDFWWELALLVVIMLLGHWIEMRSLAQTSSALDSLAALLPDQAEVVRGDSTEFVEPGNLEEGDVVVIRPGSSIPADGTIVEGSAHVDESMITGESWPVSRGKGDRVVAGTISTDSGLRVEVSATGEETTLAGIQRLVSDAQSSSSRAQRIADRAAALLFWYALTAAAITAAVWLIVGAPEDAVTRAVTVLVIACPHALGLAIPLVVSIATERAAKSGILIRDRLALESMRTVDTVVFDKTGTLTVGEPRVTGTVLATENHVSAPESSAAPNASTANGHVSAPESSAAPTEDRLLALAAAAESDSEHPLARAIAAAARESDLGIPRAQDFSSEPALGVSATVDGQKIEVGGPNLLSSHGVDELEAVADWENEGAIVLHVLADGKIAGALRLADEVRPESADAIQALHDQGTDVVMITGDAEAVANSVGTELGIDRVFAGVRPEDKAAKVSQLQGEGHKVAMVGDGVNDAPGLATADVGIAIGAGTDVAIGSAGVILASSSPMSVLSVTKLSRATYAKMRQNLWWAAGYNLLAVPLAAGVLAPVGFILPMSVGAILMSLSTVVVALNAQLLRRIDL